MADISKIQNGEEINRHELALLTVKLSLPAILAQLSSIAMQYIDASMVGHLGAEASASIGLVGTTMWLFSGVCAAMTVGFSVQVAHKIGARDYKASRKVLRQSIVATFLFGLIMSVIGIAIAFPLPGWLGGIEPIRRGASIYFLIYIAALPLLTLNFLSGGMLRCAGNMKVPSILNGVMALLDVIFNYLLIFPSREFQFATFGITIPGADMGLAGAALGTALAEIVAAFAMMYFLFFREKGLALKGTAGSYRPERIVVRKALKISAPMTLEHAVLCGAQIMITVIVAPLGVVAIAANAFAVTAESLCYMPGYGIADAATTLVGQSHGAGRRQLVRRFGYMSVGLGIIVMTGMGVLMWIGAPWMMEMMTPVKAISDLGVEVLRIEAWAEPMFAASIVGYGVFIGVGDTLIPAVMNFGSIWLVRIPIAAFLAPSMGLRGVWIAMCAELCFRGAIFLWRLIRGKWIKPGKETKTTEEYEDNIDGSWQELN